MASSRQSEDTPTSPPPPGPLWELERPAESTQSWTLNLGTGATELRSGGSRPGRPVAVTWIVSRVLVRQQHRGQKKKHKGWKSLPLRSFPQRTRRLVFGSLRQVIQQASTRLMLAALLWMHVSFLLSCSFGGLFSIC